VEPTIENVYDRIRFVSEQNCLLIDFSNLHISKIEHVNNIRKCIEELLTSHKAKEIHCLVNYDDFLVSSDELMQRYTEDVVLYLTGKYYKTVQRYTTTPSVQDVSVENFAKVLKTANMRLELCVEIIKDRYVIEDCIGEGSFGKVKLAYDRVTGKKVAIKEVDINRVRKMGVEQFVKRELKIMKQLSEASDAHVNIVRLYDVIEEGDHVRIVLEYCKGGSLENTFDEHEQFPEQKAHKYFCQIINALEYLHDRYHIMHRDLQLANICRTDNDIIKIVDFGMADYFSPTEYKHTLFAGNVNYSPPEMLLEKRYKGPEIDLWAAGCILYKMLTGYLPFRNAQRTLIGQFTIPLEEEEELSEEVKDLIRSMLNPDPQKRLTIKQIKTHPWWIKYSS
jgi:serine/threonine protein kinase